jgi:hypothetical protein
MSSLEYLKEYREQVNTAIALKNALGHSNEWLKNEIASFEYLKIRGEQALPLRPLPEEKPQEQTTENL